MVSAMSQGKHTAGPIIMIVEDYEQTNTAMKTLLELENYQVAAVADGDEALRLLRGGLRPGLILLDLRLPGKDAFQFRVEQLKDPNLSPIPVVVYSGAADVAEKAKALGAVASLHKPIEVETLLEVVARHCA